METFKRDVNPSTDPKRAVAWRTGRLRGAGFEAQLAEELARDPGYDVPALLDLIERGCPPKLAARILTPLAVAETARTTFGYRSPGSVTR